LIACPHDFYWYSPVLRPLLVDKTGDVAVLPVSVDEVLAVLRFAGRYEIPVTVRGAGTGNTASAFRSEGGIVLDLSLMDKLEEINARRSGCLPTGVAPCSARDRSSQVGWELRMYPSTLAKASVGGFLAGGSGGIGSVTTAACATSTTFARSK